MITMRTGMMVGSGGGGGGAGGGVGERGGHEWEVRPGGMLVQKRTDSDQSSGKPPPVIRVRVKYGSVYHEMNINSQATFGELKKMLSGPTGLHHQDMKIVFKDKERDSKAFLDLCGVKDRSKMVLTEDPISQEKRLLEMRKNAVMEKASKAISDISLEVDRLAGQVSAFETVINKGGRVEEKSLVNSIEMLMNQLLKLDAVAADGDVKLQRKMQVRRVQKYVETLDVLKIKNSMPDTNGGPETDTKNSEHRQSSGQRVAAPIKEQLPRRSNGQRQSSVQEQSPRNSVELRASSNHRYHHNQEQQPDLLLYDEPRNSSSSSSGPVVVTTEWETFDATPAPSTSANSGMNNPTPPSRFKWEFL